jgi:serine/threonine-protein kinase
VLALAATQQSKRDGKNCLTGAIFDTMRMMQATRKRGPDADPMNSKNTNGRNGNSAAARYEVLEREGEGSLWVTYRVRERTTGRIYALKALKSTFAKHDAFSQSLLQALEASRAWAHPRLTATFEAGVEEGTPFYVTDWISGGNLAARLRRAPFGRSEALSFVRQIGEGLEYLHAQGAAHGDLRPSQLLLMGDGNLKIADPGQGMAFSQAKLNLTDIIGDAAFYQAPEYWDNRPPSPGADLYALGVMLYQMLTGRVPFEGTSPLAIARRHRSEAPIRPSQLNPRCPTDLERITLRLLEKDPRARYVSASHLLRDLSPNGSSRTTPATPGTSPAEEENDLNTNPINPVVASAAVATDALAGAPAGAAVAGTVAGAVSGLAATTAAGAVGTPATGIGVDDAPDDEPRPARRLRRPQTTPTVSPAFPGSDDDDLNEDDAVQRERLARKKHRKREAIGALLAIFWTLVAAGLLTGIVYGAYYFWVQELPKEVRVPEYRYRNQMESERVLAGRGLKMRITREVFNPKIASGTVIGGDPKPGKSVRQGREVYVTISRGPEPIRMYDFSELTLQQARQIVMRDGLRMGQIAEQFHDRVPAGYICGQYPEPGDSFRRSDPINLIVSRGPQPTGEAPNPAQLPPPPEVTPQTPVDEPSFSNPAVAPDATLVSRAVQVRVVIPADGTQQEVRVIVRDADGEHTVYRQSHNPGDVVDETVQVTREQGTSAVVRIYVGGSLLREERV